MEVSESGQGHDKAGGSTCWGCRVDIQDMLCVSCRFGWCDLGVSLALKTTLLTLLLRPEVSKMPMKVSGSGL